MDNESGFSSQRNRFFSINHYAAFIKTHFLLILLLIYALSVSAERKAPIYVSHFGIKPYTYENNVEKLQFAIKACKGQKVRWLIFEKGRYDFWPEGAIRKGIFHHQYFDCRRMSVESENHRLAFRRYGGTDHRGEWCHTDVSR